MIYLFEDKQDERLVKLFNSMYDGEQIQHFIYTESNQNIQNNLDQISDPQTEDVIVYLDVSPDNPNTVKIYNRLNQLETKNPNIIPNRLRFRNFIVLPIPCREFYYIKALHNTQVEIRKDWVMEALSRIPYKNSTLLDIPREQRYITTFERFCKRVAYNQFKYCTIKENNLGYFDKDCKCWDTQDRYFDDRCESENIDLKLQRILQAFPCFPEGSHVMNRLTKIYSLNKLTWEDIKNIHMKLVDEYNAQVEQFRAVQSNSMNTFYKTIQYCI